MPRVSVVIPTYNRAYLIAEAIESILEQSFQDAEIIVIDDGSTDSTREVVSAFPVNYVRQENQGVVGAQNRGIDVAKGEYVALLGSDDILLERALEKSVEVLDRYPKAGFSYGQAYLVDEKGYIIGLKRHDKHSYVRDGKEEIRGLIYGNHVPASTVMLRRSCLAETGTFDPRFKEGSEDFDLWVRLAKKYDVAYIAEPLVKYRVHSGSVGVGRALTEIEEKHRLVLESVFNDPKLGPLLSSKRPEAYFHLYLQLADYAYGARDMKTARGYLSRASKIRPKRFYQVVKSPWAFQLARTWLPLPVLSSLQQGRQYLRATRSAFYRQRTNRGVK